MKKSLSLIVAIAMIVSLFSSVAFAADKTAADKFNELKAAGIFTGTGDGDGMQLDKEMDRASAAVIVARLAKLETEASTTKVFSDVDPASAPAPYIAAAVKAGIIHGNGDGTFSPYDMVKKQDLAVMLTLAYSVKTGTKVDTTATADVDASAYALPYIKAALDLKLFGDVSDWSSNAIREDLVNSTYATNDAIAASQQPATIGVAKVEATGAKQLTVTFDGAVDTTKAQLAVTRNGISVSDVTPKFADDGKSATLTLTTKLNEATYAVTLSGIDNLNADKASASVDAKAEVIKTIDITTASDTLPLAAGVKVEFQAKNQYGEVSSLSASSFTFATGDVTPVPVSGEQAITLDLSGKTKGDKVPVTIIYTDSNSSAQANKIFTVGEKPIVSKIEVGDLLDKDGNKVDSVEAGKAAYIDVKAYDQYGVRVTDVTTLNDSGNGVTVVIPDNNLVKGEDPTVTTADAFIGSVVGDDAPDVAISAISSASAKDVTVSFFANGTGQTVSKVIHIATPSVPASVDFGSFTDTIAKGDTDVYIPLVVKDAADNTLTAQQIADNASKFTVYAIGGAVKLASDVANVDKNGIHLTGADKGKIHIASADNKGTGQIVIQLASDPSKKATFNVVVNDERKADHISVSEAAASKLVYVTVAGSTRAPSSEFKFKTFDQFNGDFKESTPDNAYVTLKLEKVSGDDTALNNVSIPTNHNGVTNLSLGGTVTTDVYASEVFDSAFNWNASTSGKGTFKVTATLYKVNGGTDIELGKAVSQVEISDGKSLTLSYTASLDKVTDNTLIAADKVNQRGTLGTADFAGVNGSVDLYTKSVKIAATDSNGNTVKLPDVISTVSSSNTSIVDVNLPGDGTAKVAGIDDGTASLSILFNTPTGMSAANLSVTSKNERPVVSTIASDKSNNSTTEAHVSGINAWDSELMNKLTVTDQYGTEYVNDSGNTKIADYNLGVTYYVSDIKHSAAGSDDTVAITPAGVVTITQSGTADIASFVIHAIAPNGKEATCEISVN